MTLRTDPTLRTVAYECCYGRTEWTYGSARIARRWVARQVRSWRAAVRDGLALSVERHHGRDDMPAHFVVDWDGRTESVQLERI